MDKISWCKRKREGIRLTEPSPNLAEAYLQKAESSLEALRTTSVRDWKIAAAYSAMYFSLYAILVRIGVRCEIHSCTIQFAKQFLGSDFTNEEIGFLEDSLKARIDAQYYVNRNVPDRHYQEMARRAPKLLVKAKETLLKLNEKKILDIRKAVERA